MRRPSRLVPLLLLLLAAALTTVPATAQETRPLEYGGLRRPYLHYRPAGAAADAALPAVVVLHGAATSKEWAFERLRWREEADKAGIVVIAAEASPNDQNWGADPKKNPRLWNDGAGRGRPAMRGVDDVGYLDAVLDDALAKGGIDPARIAMAGYSMGGSMALRYASDRGARLAAVASVAGHTWIEPKTALPVLIVAGEADPLAPLDGAEGKRPLREDPARWAALAGCAAPVESRPAEGVTRFDWSGCRPGTAVSLITVAGLGHQWPGGEASKQPQLGPYSDALDADAAIVEFLRRHPLPAGGRAASP